MAMYFLRYIKVHTIYKRVSNSNNVLLNQFLNNQFRFISNKSNLNEISKLKLLDAKPNLEKDKLLFYYENPRFYQILNLFAFVHLFFWASLAEFTYRKLPTIDFEKSDKKLPWWLNFDYKKDTTRLAAAAFCVLMGYGGMSVAWVYTLRTVRMLVLRKDGRTVTFVTYTPVGGKKFLDVPLNKVSTNHTRSTAKNMLPIRVRGKWFYFLVDTKNGVLKNPDLFDVTVGMQRTFK